MKILIDLDWTLYDVTKQLISMWNKYNPDRPLKYKSNTDWKFHKILDGTAVELKELFTIFDKEDFYDNVHMFDYAEKYINQLSKKHEVIICTKHSNSRKPITEKFIKDRFSKCKLLFVDSFEDKRNIDCDIIIDDKIECLNGKAKYSICYGLYEWNKDIKYDCIRAVNWYEVEDILWKMMCAKGEI